jgi:hypothetical protein
LTAKYRIAVSLKIGFIRSMLGFEYELYDQDYDQIDGGVVDHVDYENDDIVVNLIVDLFDELEIKICMEYLIFFVFAMKQLN